jgi:beta-xylosidase
LKVLAIIFFTYLFLKYLGRILAPILLKRFATKMQDRFGQQFNQQNHNQQPPKQQEGKVTLEKTKTSTKTKSDNLGDYVDFEEVEE